MYLLTNKYSARFLGFSLAALLVFTFNIEGVLASFIDYPVHSKKWTDKYDRHFKKYSKRYFGPLFDWHWFKAQAIAESGLKDDAESHVGARGLMQIMPKTGQYIARKLNERWRGKNSLYNPVTNIKYGSYYYQKLLTQFDGHYALALAAYNAGPHRVKRWLPEDKTLPADIWIETIPYRETRDYVSTVLAYTLIYQQRTQTNELSMNDFTRDVEPLDSDS